MATDLQTVNPATPVKPAKSAKYDAYVEQQLTRARQRIRGLDAATAGLGFLVLTLAYGLAMALCDRWLEFSSLTRQAAFALYALAALAYLGVTLVLPLLQRINPYYAARKLEETLPEAKNSVVNYLDFRQETLPPAFRNAISSRAAKDLAHADLDQAISAKRTSWLGGGAFGLFLILVVLYVMGPHQFLSLLARAFAPFTEMTIATRTQLTLLRPESGDLVVPVGRAVSFAVRVDGRMPDAVRLLYRYNPGDPYEVRQFDSGDLEHEWVAGIRAAEVHTGFWYKVKAGDAETPEYRIQVRSSPLLTGFDVTAHYRPYLGWPDDVSHDPNIQNLRGTEVNLVAHTNRSVKSGQLVITGENAKDLTLTGERFASDPEALRFRFVLEKDGQYRIWFESTDGERNVEPMPYNIRVRQDHAPQVELKKPGADIDLEANGMLQLEGSASDDIGLAGMTLRLRVDEGAVLQAKPYRAGKSFRQADGTYPQMLEYKDFVELDKLKQENGQPAGLKPGQTMEYWLEAVDNCDFPAPNVGQSKHFKVRIKTPEQNKEKQEKQRQQAQKEQKQHEQKQDDRLKDEQEQKKNQEPPPQQPQEQPKKDENKNQEQQPQDGKNAEKDGEKNQGSKGEEQKVKDQADQIKKALENQDKKDQSDQKQDGEQKKDGEQKTEQQKADGQQKKDGEQKTEQQKADGQQKKDGEQKTEQQKADGQQKKDGEQKTEQQKADGQQKKDGEQKTEQQKADGQQKKDGEQKTEQQKADGQQKKDGEQKTEQQKADGQQKKDGEQKTEQQKADGQQKKDGEQKTEQQKADGQQKKDGEQKTEQQKADGQQKKDGQQKTEQQKADGQQKKDGEQKTEQQKADGQQKKDGEQKKDGQQKTEQQKADGQQKKDGEQKKDGQQKTEQQKADGQQKKDGEQKKDGQQKTDQQKADGQQKKDGEQKKDGQQKTDQQKADGQQKKDGEQKKDGQQKTEQQKADGQQKKDGEQKKDSQQKTDQQKADGQQNKDGQQKTDQQKADGQQNKDDEQKKDGQQKTEQEKADGQQKKDGEQKKGGQQKTEQQKDDGQQKNDGDQKRDGNQSPANPKKSDEQRPGEPTGTRPGEPKSGQKQGEPKPGEKSGQPAPGENDSTGKSQPMGNSDKKESQAGDVKKPQEGDKKDPAAPSDQQQTGQGAGRHEENALPGAAADKNFQKKAGNLQLEDLKKVNKDVLERAKMTPEEFEKFKKAYQEMLKREAAVKPEKENLVGPQKDGGSKMKNQGPRRVDPGAESKGKFNRVGPPVPPPEFKDSYKEFNRKLSELESSGDKK